MRRRRRQERKPFYKVLYIQVLIAIVLGVIVGLVVPQVAVQPWMKALGDGFVKLIKMVITPIIFCTVVSGIAHISDARKVGRVALKALFYFEVISTQSLRGEAGPRPVTADGFGPFADPLRVRVHSEVLGPTRVMIAAGAPLRALAGPLHEILTPLVVTLLLLASGLIAGVVVQVRLGLRPLTRLRAELYRVRTGRADRIAGPQPYEVRPVVDELNSLLDQNALNLERARRHVANLAHGLKTPLATLALAFDEPGADPGGGFGPLVANMDRLIRHHLARARAAALGGDNRNRVDLAAALADHLAVFAKLYADKAVAYETRLGSGLAVACEAQDLDEIMGNLLDNASKWTRTRVLVTASVRNARVELGVEDDGPGLSSGQADHVMKLGGRIDETAPGYGFGLPITRELVELYGGSLTLGRSGLGGLRATFDLPGAP